MVVDNSEGKKDVANNIVDVTMDTDAAKSKITTSQRATLNQQERTYSHLNEMDLKGAQRVLDGNPVPKPGGGYYDIQEHSASIKARKPPHPVGRFSCETNFIRYCLFELDLFFLSR